MPQKMVVKLEKQRATKITKGLIGAFQMGHFVHVTMSSDIDEW